MRSRHKYFVDTKANCFLCMKLTTVDGATKPRSLISLLCYLQVDTRKILFDLVPLEDQEVIVNLCASCCGVITKFDKLYHQLEVVRLVLNANVKAIAELMAASEKDADRKEAYNQLISNHKAGDLINLTGSEHLWKLLLQLCTLRVKSSFPEIKLERMKVVTPSPAKQGISEYFEGALDESEDDVSLLSAKDDQVSPEDGHLSDGAFALPKKELEIQNNTKINKEKRWSCPHCPQHFKCYDGLRKHKFMKHRNIIFADCKKELSISEDKLEACLVLLFKNLKRSKDGTYLCSYCSHVPSCRQRSYVETHMISSHFNELKDRLKEILVHGYDDLSKPEELQKSDKEVEGDIPSDCFRCHICARVVTTIRHENHMMTHTGEKPLKCPICPERFLHDTILRRHMSTTHRDVIFAECKDPTKVTDEEFRSGIAKLFDNLNQPCSSRRKYFPCNFCGRKPFEYRKGKEAHMMSAHFDLLKNQLRKLLYGGEWGSNLAGDPLEIKSRKVQKRKESWKGKLKTIFNCAHCNNEFQTHLAYRAHLLTQHQFEVFAKYLPSDATEDQVKQTVKQVVRNQCRKLGEGSGLQWICQFPKCNVKFGERWKIKEHILVSHFNEVIDKIKSHPPTDLGQEENSEEEEVDAPRKKMRRPAVTTSEIHRCDICNKEFKIKCTLKLHRMTHTGEKPQCCPYCPKRFRIGEALKKHKLIKHRLEIFIESGEFNELSFATLEPAVARLFHGVKKEAGGKYVGRCSCAYCAKGFKNKGLLEAHLMEDHFNLMSAQLKKILNDPIQDCKMDVCKHASKINTLKTPRNSGKWATCKKCSTTVRTDWLSTHLMTHTGQKPFSCPNCPERFRDKNNLKLHRFRKHKANIFADCVGPKLSSHVQFKAAVAQLFLDVGWSSETRRCFCKYCDKTYCNVNSKALLGIHMVENHFEQLTAQLKEALLGEASQNTGEPSGGGSSNNEPISSSPPKKRINWTQTEFRCAHCQEKFPNHLTRRTHIMSRHKFEVFAKYFPAGTSADTVQSVIQRVLRLVNGNILLKGNFFKCRFQNCALKFFPRFRLDNHVLESHFKEIVARLKDYLHLESDKIKGYGSASILRNEPVATEEEPVFCSYCKEMFINVAEVKRHEQLNHRQDIFAECRESCDSITDEQFMGAIARLFENIRELSVGKRNACLYCGIRYGSRVDVECHLIQCHFKVLSSHLKEILNGTIISKKYWREVHSQEMELDIADEVLKENRDVMIVDPVERKQARQNIIDQLDNYCDAVFNVEEFTEGETVIKLETVKESDIVMDPSLDTDLDLD